MQYGELRLMLHSFSLVSVMTKSQGYLRFWVQSPKQRLETFFQRPRPRTRSAGLEAPRGQGHVLEDSNSAMYRKVCAKESQKHYKLMLNILYMMHTLISVLEATTW